MRSSRCSGVGSTYESYYGKALRWHIDCERIMEVEEEAMCCSRRRSVRATYESLWEIGLHMIPGRYRDYATFNDCSFVSGMK